MKQCPNYTFPHFPISASSIVRVWCVCVWCDSESRTMSSYLIKFSCVTSWRGSSWTMFTSMESSLVQNFAANFSPVCVLRTETVLRRCYKRLQNVLWKVLLKARTLCTGAILVTRYVWPSAPKFLSHMIDVTLGRKHHVSSMLSTRSTTAAKAAKDQELVNLSAQATQTHPRLPTIVTAQIKIIKQCYLQMHSKNCPSRLVTWNCTFQIDNTTPAGTNQCRWTNPVKLKSSAPPCWFFMAQAQEVLMEAVTLSSLP